MIQVRERCLMFSSTQLISDHLIMFWNDVMTCTFVLRRVGRVKGENEKGGPMRILSSFSSNTSVYQFLFFFIIIHV